MSTVRPTLLEQAEAAKRTALRQFGKLGIVASIGITRVKARYALKVNLSEPVAPGVELPTEIDGVPVHVEVIGTIRAR